MPHPSDTRPGPGGRWALSSRADTGRAWSPSGGWCCTGLRHGKADSDTCLPGGTGGLQGQDAGEALRGHLELLAAFLVRLLPSLSTSQLPGVPCPHTCASRWAEAGEGTHAVYAGGSWGAGGSKAVVQVLLAAGAPPSRSHTHSESHQLSSGTCPHFCSAWGPGPHTRPRLWSSPSLQGVGRGQGLGRGAREEWRLGADCLHL